MLARNVVLWQVLFQQHIFNILASRRALLAKYMEYSIIEGVDTKSLAVIAKIFAILFFSYDNII
jgi:hypothetical protein